MVVAILATLLVLEVRREVGDPGNSDYIAFATGAHLVATDPQHLYAPQAQAAVQAGLLHLPEGAQFLNRYINLPAGAFLLSPLAHLDLHTGALVAAIGSLLLFAACFVLASRVLGDSVPPPARVLIAACCVFSIPAIDAVLQWDSLLTCAVLLSVLLAQRERYMAAGMVLATVLLKPQTAWLVAPALAAAQSWRYLAGLGLGAAAWVGASVVIAGPQSLTSMVQLIAESPRDEASISVGIPSLVAMVTGSGAAAFAAAALLSACVAALFFVARSRLRGRPVTAVALGISASLLCAPHVSAQDLMLVTLPVVLIARRRLLLATVEALSLSVAALIQEALWAPARHFQPVLLGVITLTTAVALLGTRARGGRGRGVSGEPSPVSRVPARALDARADPAPTAL